MPEPDPSDPTSTPNPVVNKYYTDELTSGWTKDDDNNVWTIQIEIPESAYVSDYGEEYGDVPSGYEMTGKTHVADADIYEITNKKLDEHFRITVTIAVSPQFFGWIISLGSGVKIVAPDSVVEQMKEVIAEQRKLYK